METVRRIAIVAIWALTLFFGGLTIVLSFQGDFFVFFSLGIGIFSLGWVASIICNWVLVHFPSHGVG